MTSLVHTADVHLRPDADERLTALDKVLAVATDRDADVLTIGGDLFDRPEDVEQLRSDLRNRFFTDRSFEIILIPGNHDVEAFRGWIKNQFKSFIENAKQFEILPDEIESKLDTANPRQYHFGHCGIYLLQQYQRYLVEQNFIDFTDMINRSLDLIEQKPTQFRSRYDHILVDEFQDLGKGQLDLIKSLTDGSGPRLFAVGDDWQSIYSFRGAVVEYFINFEAHFGSPVQTVLDRNFRSPPAIIAAGNELIAHNDDQIDKTVTPTITFDSIPLVHTLRGQTYWGYVHKVATYTVDLVLSYLEEGASPGDIMILCRFDGAVPYLDEIKSELRERKVPYEGKSDHYGGSVAYSGAASVYSVYQSKGREARHVIIVHAVEGPFGFPPSGRKDELLDPVKPFDVDTLAEERRAFYVAITRAEETVDILTQDGDESQFINELGDNIERVDRSEAVEPLDDVGTKMTVTARIKQLFDDVHKKKHQDGIIVDRYGGSARIVSWASNNSPTIQQGTWYQFENVRVDEYKNRKELVVTADSAITELEDPEAVAPLLRRESESEFHNVTICCNLVA